MTDCDLLIAHQNARFVFDARGRFNAWREARSEALPRFRLGRSRHGNIWSLSEDLPSDLVRRLSRLAGREMPLPDALPPWSGPERLRAIALALGSHAETRVSWSGALFHFESIRSRLRELGAESRMLSAEDLRFEDWLGTDFEISASEVARRGPCRIAVEHGRVVSVCFAGSSDISAGVQARVKTLAAHDDPASGARCLAAWSLDVIEAGGIPLFSASWDDRSSQALANWLGISPYGEAIEFI